MAKSPTPRLPVIIAESAGHILSDWLSRTIASRDTRLAIAEVEDQCESIVSRLASACRQSDLSDVDSPAFGPLRETVADISLSRALQGFTATETATFVLSLKAPLFARLRAVLASEPERLAADTLTVSELLDAIALHMMEHFHRTREELIRRQHGDDTDAWTPAVRLWQGILVLALTGRPESGAFRPTMENLLESIVRHEAVVVIIDLTDVPDVDDAIAGQIIQTATAARLMGAECMLSGVRPSVALAMARHGDDRNIVAKPGVAEAFAAALGRLGQVVVSQRADGKPQ